MTRAGSGFPPSPADRECRRGASGAGVGVGRTPIASRPHAARRRTPGRVGTDWPRGSAGGDVARCDAAYGPGLHRVLRAVVDDRAPEAKHVAPSVSLHQATRAGRRRRQGLRRPQRLAAVADRRAAPCCRADRVMCGGFDERRSTAPLGGRAPHSRAGRPARGLCGGSAGGVEAQDGSARGGGAGVAEPSCGSTPRAQTPEAASSAARGHSAGTLFTRYGAVDRASAPEPVGLMLASAARHRTPEMCTHDSRRAVPCPPQARD